MDRNAPSALRTLMSQTTFRSCLFFGRWLRRFQKLLRQVMEEIQIEPSNGPILEKENGFAAHALTAMIIFPEIVPMIPINDLLLAMEKHQIKERRAISRSQARRIGCNANRSMYLASV